MVNWDSRHLSYLNCHHVKMLKKIESKINSNESLNMKYLDKLGRIDKSEFNDTLSDLRHFKMICEGNHEFLKITYYGYDMLVLNEFMKKKLLKDFGSKINVGKESDIYIVLNPDFDKLILKLYRLGRNSFKNARSKCEYSFKYGHTSWINSSKLAAQHEFNNMNKLYDNGFKVPKPIAFNRHGILMSLIDGCPLKDVFELKEPIKQYEMCRKMLIKLCKYGLVHGDFNEYNLMLDKSFDIYMIDFPQMVSINHYRANEYFIHDRDCIVKFFNKRFNLSIVEYITIFDIPRKGYFDLEIKASGWNHFRGNVMKLKSKVLDDNSGESSLDSNSDVNEINDTLSKVDIGS